MNYDWFSSSELFTISSSPPDCARTERDCSNTTTAASLYLSPLYDHNIYTTLCPSVYGPS